MDWLTGSRALTFKSSNGSSYVRLNTCLQLVLYHAAVSLIGGARFHMKFHVDDYA